MPDREAGASIRSSRVFPGTQPPGIGGYQRGDGQTGGRDVAGRGRVLPCCTQRTQTYQFAAERPESPLLVVGQHGAGRTAALATDVAPHWVGGFVDWGDQRIVQDVGGGPIEVGNWYARFFRNFVAWARPRMHE